MATVKHIRYTGGDVLFKLDGTVGDGLPIVVIFRKPFYYESIHFEILSIEVNGEELLTEPVRDINDVLHDEFLLSVYYFIRDLIHLNSKNLVPEAYSPPLRIIVIPDKPFPQYYGEYKVGSHYFFNPITPADFDKFKDKVPIEWLR